MSTNRTSSVHIRALHVDDLAQWELMFRQYAAFYSTTTGADTESTAWGWIFDEHNDFWCDLAVDESGTILGFTQYQLMHRSLGGAMVCYLSDLFVDPQVRGQGVGSAMINHVIEFAGNRGIANVRWLTQDFNYPARALYDNFAKKSDFILYSVSVE